MRLLVRASAGLWLWAFGFSLLYGLHGIGCASGWNLAPLAGGTVFGWTMIGTWLLIAAAAAGTFVWARRAPSGLERRLSVTSALVGFLGTIVTGAPVLAATACL